MTSLHLPVFFPQAVYKLNRFMHLHIFSPVEKNGTCYHNSCDLVSSSQGFLEKSSSPFYWTEAIVRSEVLSWGGFALQGMFGTVMKFFFLFFF